MDSPFDEILDAKNESNQQSKVQESPKEKKSETRKVSKGVGAIERIIWVLLIVGLSAILIANPSQYLCTSDKDSAKAITSNVVAAPVQSAQQQDQPLKLEEKNQSTKITISSSESQNNVTIEKTDQKPVANAPEKPFRQNFDFKIENVDYTKDDKGKPIKMKSVTFSMWNRWKTFTPRIEVYWYDKDSGDIIKNKKRSVSTILSASGTLKTYRIDAFDSTFFNPINREETVELKLYDSEANVSLISASDIIGLI